VRRLIVLLLFAQVVPVSAQPLARYCAPPDEPYVPVDDQNLKEYADMIASDFERYFKQLTDYFRCMDETRMAVFERAQEMSKVHQEFRERAAHLGIAPDTLSVNETTDNEAVE